jgi:hypothetical protein
MTSIEFYSVTILLTNGTDKIVFKTNLHSPYPAMGFEPYLSMEAAHGHGVQYCEKHFPGVQIEVIDAR